MFYTVLQEMAVLSRNDRKCRNDQKVQKVTFLLFRENTPEESLDYRPVPDVRAGITPRVEEEQQK